MPNDKYTTLLNSYLKETQITECSKNIDAESRHIPLANDSNSNITR